LFEDPNGLFSSITLIVSLCLQIHC